MRRMLPGFVLPLLLAACGDDATGAFVCTPGQPVVVSYDNLGTFQTSLLIQGGLTVSGSGLVNVLDLNGLGVVGGAFDNTVDGAESLRFSVNVGVVANLAYWVPSAGNGDGDQLSGEATIEAFDRSGTSLGLVPVAGTGLKTVSVPFGDVPISAFVVKADGDLFRINQVDYRPCV